MIKVHCKNILDCKYLSYITKNSNKIFYRFNYFIITWISPTKYESAYFWVIRHQFSNTTFVWTIAISYWDIKIYLKKKHPLNKRL